MKSVAFLSLLIFVSFLPKYTQQRCPSLPSDPNAKIYQELQKIPSPQTTAKKLLDNFIGFQPRQGKRTLELKDSVVILDGSGSVSYCEFGKGRKALTNLVGSCEEITTQSCRFAGITYSSSATVVFKFLPPIQASNKMRAVSYPSGGTNTQAALAEAEKLFKDATAGSRPWSEKKVFLVTDGQSNIDKHLTVPNAQKLKKMGAKVFVVAVGQYINGIDEMARVASFPPQRYLFRVEKYAGFLDVVNLALKQLPGNKYKVVKSDPPC